MYGMSDLSSINQPPWARSCRDWRVTAAKLNTIERLELLGIDFLLNISDARLLINILCFP